MKRMIIMQSVVLPEERERWKEGMGGERQTDRKGLVEGDKETSRHTGKQTYRQVDIHTYILTSSSEHWKSRSGERGYKARASRDLASCKPAAGPSASD